MTRNRTFLTLLVGALSCFSLAGTFTVTAPRTGDYLGRSNTLKFTVTGGVVQARVIARATKVPATFPPTTFSTQRDFTPNADGNIDGSLPLTFDRSTPEGTYRLDVEIIEPGNTYTPNPVVLNGIIIDVVEPKFLDSNPVSGGYVRGLVPIIAQVQENPTSLEEWRVQINGQDIQNNTGTTQNIAVNWDTSSIERDGVQSISITAKDRAQNNAVPLSISVTLDRVPPSTSISSPPTSFQFRRGTIIPVSVDFVDQFSGSVNASGIDMQIVNMAGNVLGRVTRVNTTNNGGTLRYIGRILNTQNLPSPFKIRIDATDRAGNPAVRQETVVNLR
jgi:hypothetical protein